MSGRREASAAELAAIEVAREMVAKAFGGRRKDQVERHLTRGALGTFLAAAFLLGAAWQRGRS